MAQSRQYELVLLGATGYTGKLTAEWISQHLPTDLRWAVAGRNEAKLQKVVEELKTLSPDRKPPAIEPCPHTESDITTLALQTRLLIATVGPFMHHGEPALAACAKSGTHYLDCTGEIPWIHEMLPKYQSIAQSTGAILIPECGLDSVPADMLAYVLTAAVRRMHGAGTTNLIMSLIEAKGGFSGGTQETILELFSHYGALKLGETLSPWSISPVPPTNPVPSPKGSSLLQRLFGLISVPELGGLQAQWLMAGVDRCITHRSWGLYEARAKQTGDASLSYGARFNFNEYMRAKSLLLGAAINAAMAIFGILFAFPPTRWVLAPLVKRFVFAAAGQGPSRESMKGDFLSYKAVAVADTPKRERMTASLHIPHGGYIATAQTLSAAAWVILRGRLEETEAGRIGGGFVTPATLGSQMAEKMVEFGMKLEVGV